MIENIYKTYQSRKNNFHKSLVSFQNKANYLANMRLLLAILIIGILLYGIHLKSYPIILCIIPLILLFILLVIQHGNVRNKIKYLQNFIIINDNCLARLSGKWISFPDTGKELINHSHKYSFDLNIYGQGSLFQYINVTTTFMGEQLLSKALNEGAPLKEIRFRQKSLRELTHQLDWMQHFQATGLNNERYKQNPENLIEWAESKKILIQNKYYPFLWALPGISLLAMILAFFKLVPNYIWLISLLAQLLIIACTEKQVRLAFEKTGKAISDLERYSLLLKCIEEHEYEAELLVRLRAKLFLKKNPASRQIMTLSKIADRISVRYSELVHLILNVLIFWDLTTLAKLEKWRERSGVSLRNWLNVIGEFDLLSAFAGMAYDNPDWVYPDIIDYPPFLEAKLLGHPLIMDDIRICNDVSLPCKGTTLIITGSNMSGKSTFLRTIGLNLVLAYCGAPVCASHLRCSMMNLYTSMYVADNLEQKISTFYAELKRIKTIIDAALAGENVLFLLDEILKGTNSKDRVYGAKAIIQKLSKLSTLGIVTTHDLELGSLEKECPSNIKNYHFADNIFNGWITFDYRLNPGISQSTNALALMKMVGIDIEK